MSSIIIPCTHPRPREKVFFELIHRPANLAFLRGHFRFGPDASGQLTRRLRICSSSGIVSPVARFKVTLLVVSGQLGL